MAFLVLGNAPALGVGGAGLTSAVHHLGGRVDLDVEHVRTADGVEAGHVRTLDGREVFTGHRERHMAVDAVHLLVGVGLGDDISCSLWQSWQVCLMAGLV